MTAQKGRNLVAANAAPGAQRQRCDAMTTKKEIVELDDGDRVLSAESIEWILEAVMLGLVCWGELEKALSAIKGYKAISGKRPEWIDVRHPTGTADVTACFATALQVLQ